MAKKTSDNPAILKTSGTVIDALGGNQAVMKLACTTAANVSNWRAAGRFPSNTYVLFRTALMDLGFYAPPSLWGMREIKAERQAC
jgi:hypothetical protein